MQSIIVVMLVTSFLFACKGNSNTNQINTIPSDGYSTPANYANMTTVWADEFNDSTLNARYWNFELGNGCPKLCGWGNNELEFYKKENTKVENGYLTIEAKKETAGTYGYTSSRITTQGKFNLKFGRIDVRAKLPEGQGIWPGIWMLGKNIDSVKWPACGEIDIMEMIGGNDREKNVHGTAHWDNNGRHASYGNSYSLPAGTFSDKFHVFSITWNAQKIIWYVDDRKYHEIDITPPELSELNKEFFFLINLAIGGNWPGDPDNTTIFPQKLIVDYIRVFQ